MNKYFRMVTMTYLILLSAMLGSGLFAGIVVAPVTFNTELWLGADLLTRFQEGQIMTETVREAFARLEGHVRKRIVGQEALVQRLLLALLADGHLLLEGAPGLAKTRAIKALAEGLEADFHRIQFTPDLLPADLTGSDIYRPEQGRFQFNPGPVFHNLILADEVNRAPAKVQSALLEAMEERQVTVGAASYDLPGLFLVWQDSPTWNTLRRRRSVIPPVITISS